MPLKPHHCLTEDGFRIVCICTTGIDHNEYEMDIDPAKVGQPQPDEDEEN